MVSTRGHESTLEHVPTYRNKRRRSTQSACDITNKTCGIKKINATHVYQCRFLLFFLGYDRLPRYVYKPLCHSSCAKQSSPAPVSVSVIISTFISNVLSKLMDFVRTRQRIINVGTESIILTVVDSAENEARTTRRSIGSAYLWEHPRPIPVPVYTISQLAC